MHLRREGGRGWVLMRVEEVEGLSRSAFGGVKCEGLTESVKREETRREKERKLRTERTSDLAKANCIHIILCGFGDQRGLDAMRLALD